ncbi:ABC transporter substrate-binding protein [Corynebacterium maris DSM 45190]|uniref:ABC transporter substrate-binding protein n=1 Tax=Corynebacterium maris DSM 45190 TaxID=1224163 RepID=S5SW49_9CORY|nr:ABC transporter substrate-binding protein [Corynebacterium maris]AGS35444.1 ABC transporter substrate-binding protein [Corynebacterium maris DSM 45190]
MLIRRVVLACTVVLALALPACSAGSTATQVGRVDDGVVVGTVAAPASLDFTSTGGAAIPQALMANVYETLVRIDEDGEIVPHLATGWDVSDDRLTYTFHLRDGVTFSNGEEFTAETAAFSIDYVQNEWTNGLKSQMDPVAQARAVDPLTLEVTLAHPSNEWLWSMGTLTGAMMTPTGTQTLATDPIGTGPYTVERFAVGESVSYSARADYWGEPADGDAAIRYFSDAVGSVNALRSGDVDVVWSLQAPELLDTLPEEFGVEVGTTNGELLLSMNNDAAPFDDVRVRQAVAYGVDREAVSQVVYEGLATDTGGAPVPPTDPWFTGRDYYSHDPERARRLLREAGYSEDDRPQVTMKIPSLPYAETAAELLFSELRQIGFDVSLVSSEFPAVWLSEVMGSADYQMSLIAHVEPRDVPVLFGNPDHYLRFDSEPVREHLARADSGDDQVGHMRRAVDEIMAEAGSLTLVNTPNIVLTAPGVTGVEANVVTDALPLAEIGRSA